MSSRVGTGQIKKCKNIFKETLRTTLVHRFGFRVFGALEMKRTMRLIFSLWNSRADSAKAPLFPCHRQFD